MDDEAALILTGWAFCTQPNDHALFIQETEVMLVSVNNFFSFIF